MSTLQLIGYIAVIVVAMVVITRASPAKLRRADPPAADEPAHHEPDEPAIGYESALMFEDTQAIAQLLLPEQHEEDTSNPGQVSNGFR